MKKAKPKKVVKAKVVKTKKVKKLAPVVKKKVKKARKSRVARPDHAAFVAEFIRKFKTERDKRDFVREYFGDSPDSPAVLEKLKTAAELAYTGEAWSFPERRAK